jgi:hypothetical protein
MISFRDRTYCAAEDCKKFKGCDRALTPEVYRQAAKWWGSDEAPIAVADRFECFIEKEGAKDE